MVGDTVHASGLIKGVDQCRAAIILREWVPGDNVEERHVGTVQLAVFPDGSNDVREGEPLTQRILWATSVQHVSKATGPSSYHYASECSA